MPLKAALRMSIALIITILLVDVIVRQPFIQAYSQSFGTPTHAVELISHLTCPHA